MSISSAIKFITSSEHCLLIADLQLPGMDKLEMIRVLRIMTFDPIIAIADHLESNELVTSITLVQMFIWKSR